MRQTRIVLGTSAIVLTCALVGAPLIAPPASAAAGLNDYSEVPLEFDITGLTGTLELYYSNGDAVTYGNAAATEGSIASIQFKRPFSTPRISLLVRSSGGPLTAHVEEGELILIGETSLRGTASYSSGTVTVSVNGQKPETVPNGSFSFFVGHHLPFPIPPGHP
jgi:hypothetical protein